MDEGGQKLKTSSSKINKFWGSNVQHDDCCTAYSKVAKRIGLKSSYHKKKNYNYVELIDVN